ncbi:MAG: ABC transporter substrate-binding protein [Thermofilaceae archaeon]
MDKPRSTSRKISMYMIIIFVTLILLAASWAYFLTRLQAPQLKPLTDPDTLVMGTDISVIISLDPAEAYELEGCMIVNQLYDKLVELSWNPSTGQMEVTPEIAESWEVSADGLTWIFRIRKGVTFADGSPLNADAVAFSLKRVVKLAKTPSWLITQFGITEDSIEKVDDYTIHIKLGQKVAPQIFLSCLAFTTSGVVNPSVVLANEKEGDMGSEWLKDHSAGSGPFILEKWEREAEGVLIANENYWREKPRVKRIVIKHVAEPINRVLMLERGDIDIAWGLTTELVGRVRDVVGIRIATSPVFTKEYLAMNVNFEPFKDERVRDAVRWAIDYEAILRFLGDQATPLQTFIDKGIPGYNPLMPYYRDLGKAKQLLAEAGYPNGFEVEMLASTAYPARDIAAIIKENLEEIGIKVNLRLITSAEMYKIYRQQAHQLILAGWGADYPDPDALAKPFANYRARQLAWRNVWYDDYAANLTEMAAQEMNWEKRLALYKELTEYVVDKGPYAILYQNVEILALRTWVEGFTLDPMSLLPDLWRVYKEKVYG